MLEVKNLDAYYGDAQVLFDVSFKVMPGEVMTLIGRNGMGKTTILNSIMGFIKIEAKEIKFNQKSILRLPVYQIARQGIGLVPEGRQIFQNLTVLENLDMVNASKSKQNKLGLSKVFSLFPELFTKSSHMGNQLSGGEQQMLSIGRALMLNPALLLMDEAMEGVAPKIQHRILHTIKELCQLGVAVVLVDKSVELLTSIEARHQIIEKGRFVWQGNSDLLKKDRASLRKHIGIGL